MDARAFSHTIPRLWNSLPENLHNTDSYHIQNMTQNLFIQKCLPDYKGTYKENVLLLLLITVSRKAS